MSSPLFQSPIASPYGAGQPYHVAPLPDDKMARLVVSLPLAAVCRYAMFEWFNPGMLRVIVGAPLLAALAVTFVRISRFGLGELGEFPMAFVFMLFFFVGLFAPIIFLLRLLSRRLFVVQISRNGLSKLYGKRDIFFPWSKFQRVIERDGDLWLACFFDGCFIPRDAFVSREEAREFAAIVRSLIQTGGTSWRSEWEGRVFGVHPYGHVAPISE